MSDFSDYPPSVGEIKSGRSGKSADWTPREALLHVLREIDAGKLQPDVMVIAWSSKQDNKRTASYRQSASDSLLSLGLLQSVLFEMQD
jgi:hypothetical protein